MNTLVVNDTKYLYTADMHTCIVMRSIYILMGHIVLGMGMPSISTI